jgi:hypothetical protein
VAEDQSYRARPGYFDPGGAAHMHASLRASDPDREQLVDVLKAAFSEGRLDQDEYTARMEQAYSAKTYGELRNLVSDLPGASPAQVPYQFSRYAVAKPANSLAVASMVLGLATPLFGLTAIPAVILGHKARRQIRYTGERGSGMALTGLIIGWAAIGLFVLLVTVGILAAIASTGGSSVGPSFGNTSVKTLQYVPPQPHHHPHAPRQP